MYLIMLYEFQTGKFGGDDCAPNASEPYFRLAVVQSERFYNLPNITRATAPRVWSCISNVRGVRLGWVGLSRRGFGG